MSHLNCTVFEAVFKTKSCFCLKVFLLSINVKRRKSDNNYFSILLVIVKFSASCIFGITGSTSNNEQSTVFGTESVLKGLPMTSKAASDYFGQIVGCSIIVNISRIDTFRADMNKKGFT